MIGKYIAIYQMEKRRHTEFTTELAQPPVDAVNTLQYCLTREVHLTYHWRRRLLRYTWSSRFLKVGKERPFPWGGHGAAVSLRWARSSHFLEVGMERPFSLALLERFLCGNEHSLEFGSFNVSIVTFKLIKKLFPGLMSWCCKANPTRSLWDIECLSWLLPPRTLRC